MKRSAEELGLPELRVAPWLSSGRDTIVGDNALPDTPLTDADIQAIEKRLEGTTPGPWIEHLERRDELSGSDVISTADQDIYLPGASEADYVFIANARQDIPRLLTEIARLRREISEA